MQAAVSQQRVEQFLVVTHATFPLSTVVLGSAQAGWFSANRQVAVWMWPQRPWYQAEGRLKIQVGGHGPQRGHFVQIDLDAIGRGTVRQDEFGLAPLYVCVRDGFSFVANRPNLVALAQRRVLGRWPERDHVFSALLTFKGYPMGDRTGYVGVRCVPFMAYLQVSPSCVRIVNSSAHPPWLLSNVPSTGDFDHAIDELEALLVREMRQAVADRPSHVGRPQLQLTGGRDSRLVLALAIRSGLVDDFDVITHGRRRTADVRIARQVAWAANVRHVVDQWPRVADDPFDHVGTTAGALGLSEACRRDPRSGQATVISGLLGETLSSNFPSTAPLSTRSQVLRASVAQPNLDLLTEPAWVDAVTEAIRLLMAPLGHGAKTEDLHDVFYIQHRIRRWISVRPDAFSETVFPLYSPSAVRCAFALGWQGRVTSRVHHAIIERAGRGIADIPYASAKRAATPYRTTIRYPERGPLIGNAPDLARIVTAWRERRPRWHLPNADPSRTLKGTAHTARDTSRDRRNLYRDIIGATVWNPAFDVIDKGRLIETVERLEQLPLHLAKQVHGAMASVIWLGGMEN